MKVLDGRGQNKIEDSKRNLKAVKAWFMQNPEGTITGCCKSLKLSYPTVRKHLDSLLNHKQADIEATK